MEGDDLNRALDALAALSDHEAALGELYSVCATTWADDAGLWTTLADSEHGHASSLRELARIVSTRPGGFAPGRPLTAAAGRLQAAYLANRAREVTSGKITRRAALVMAREIEHSILETRFDELLVTHDPEYRAICEKVVAETGTHYRMLGWQLDGAD